MTTNIAPFPFLGVLPLFLYLLSFILCFSEQKFYNRRIWIALFSFAVGPTLWMSMIWRLVGLPVLVVVCSATLLAGCMVCHGELARLKPHKDKLTGFYLTIAAGGVMGGLFVSLAAPALFTHVLELVIACTAIFVLAGISLNIAPEFSKERTTTLRRGLMVVWFAAAVVIAAIGTLPLRAERDVEAAHRNFYGRVSVQLQNGRRSLLYGRIHHGSQFVNAPDRPTLYYNATSGVGLTILELQKRGPAHVAVIGLGAGTLSTYGRAEDRIRFYELNPAVIDLAKKHFSFLEDSRAEISIVEGDARISMEQELKDSGPMRFDLIVADAFSSEAMPVHLLTQEAFALYRQHLAGDGVIAVNITNTYLDLSSVIRNLADSLDMHAMYVHSEANESSPAKARWVLMTSNQSFVDSLNHVQSPWPSARKDTLFTDSYSNLLDVLK
jgi:hypothetical protein